MSTEDKEVKIKALLAQIPQSSSFASVSLTKEIAELSAAVSLTKEIAELSAEIVASLDIYRQRQITFHSLMAQWWIARATTGECLRRKLTDGAGRDLTDEEIVANTLQVARNHIDLVHQLTIEVAPG